MATTDWSWSRKIAPRTWLRGFRERGDGRDWWKIQVTLYHAKRTR